MMIHLTTNLILLTTLVLSIDAFITSPNKLIKKGKELANEISASTKKVKRNIKSFLSNNNDEDLTTTGSCANACDYDSSRDCQCNSKCLDYNDCCDDWLHYCASCAEVGCTSYDSNRECQCNSLCANYENCCDDYEDYCESHVATECLGAPSVSVDRRTDKTSLRIIEYNMDWLFTDYDHSMGTIVCPGDCDWTSNSDAESHLETIASYISKLNPDILLIEEVSDCWELQELINAMPDINGIPATSLYLPYLILGADTYTGENCGFITKIDPIINLTRSTEYVEYPLDGSNCGYTSSSGSSGCTKHFSTTFNIEGLNKFLTLIGLHFLSQPTNTKNCAKREAQATVISHIIENAYELDYEILVAGDFNDYDDEIIDAAGDVPTSRVAKIIRESADLVNVVSLIDDIEQRYSDWYDIDGSCIDEGGSEHTLIDQFYVSDGLFEKITNVEIDHSYTNGCDCMYSDHWPIIVDFDLSANNDGNLLDDKNVNLDK